MKGTTKERDNRRREQLRAASARYQKKHPDRYKASQRKTYQKHGLRKRLNQRYGLSVEAYDLLLAAQNGHCAICPATSYTPGSTQRLAVDHDHVTGKVRGLLCFACNSMLGRAEDKPERLEAGASYLRKHNGGVQ